MSYLDDSTTPPPPIDETAPESAPARKGMSGCAKGCLIAFALFLFAMIVAVILLIAYHRQLIGAGMKYAAVRIVDALPLPAEDIAEGKVVVRDLVDAWEEKRLTSEELGQSLDALKGKSNVLALTLSVVAFNDIKKWSNATAITPSPDSPLGKSGLSPDERTRFIATAHRFVAAAEVGSVSDETLDAFWSELKPGGGQQQISDVQLRKELQLMEDTVRVTSPPERDHASPTQGIADVLGEMQNLRDRVK